MQAPQEGGSRLPDLAVEAVVCHAVDVGQAVVAGHRHLVPVGRQVNLRRHGTRTRVGG